MPQFRSMAVLACEGGISSLQARVGTVADDAVIMSPLKHPYAINLRSKMRY